MQATAEMKHVPVGAAFCTALRDMDVTLIGRVLSPEELRAWMRGIARAAQLLIESRRQTLDAALCFTSGAKPLLIQERTHRPWEETDKTMAAIARALPVYAAIGAFRMLSAPAKEGRAGRVTDERELGPNPKTTQLVVLESLTAPPLVWGFEVSAANECGELFEDVSGAISLGWLPKAS